MNDGSARVALETTLLLHGVPRPEARPLATRLASIVRENGAVPMLAGVVRGRPIVGLTDEQLDELLAAPAESVKKLNTSNLGPALFRARHGATTVSTTMELAARAGVSLFATGGLGGVHRASAAATGADGASTNCSPLDVSSDLLAFTRFPVAVVTSGVKSILDVPATRELLETLGVCVVGFRTDDFPAFYLRREPTLAAGSLQVDERFNDVSELAAFLRFELARTNRGVVICNPISPEHELRIEDWRRWLVEAELAVASSDVSASGRGATPALLGALHELSGGATLRANIALVEANTELASRLAVAMLK